MRITRLRRREFVALLGGAVAWPLATRAQQAAPPVIGFLDPGLPEANAAKVSAFRKGLADAGYVEGKNVTIEFRWAENRFERLSAMASDLVARQVAVIVAAGAPTSALAAKSATSTIPIDLIGDCADAGCLGFPGCQGEICDDGIDNDGDWNPFTDDVGTDGTPDSLESGCLGAYGPGNLDPAEDNFEPTKTNPCKPDPNTGNFPRKNDRTLYTEKNSRPDHGEPGQARGGGVGGGLENPGSKEQSEQAQGNFLRR